MDNGEQRGGVTLAGRSGEHAGVPNIWKLGALLVLVLLMADLLTRQIGLLADSAGAPVPGKATTNFFKVQVGDFHAEIEWNASASLPSELPRP